MNYFENNICTYEYVYDSISVHKLISFLYRIDIISLLIPLILVVLLLKIKSTIVERIL